LVGVVASVTPAVIQATRGQQPDEHEEGNGEDQAAPPMPEVGQDHAEDHGDQSSTVAAGAAHDTGPLGARDLM
jgi:hypothetical protein